MNFEKVRDIIVRQLDLDPASVTMESRLIDDLKADSLDIVIMDLEQEFDVEIPDEELPNVRTVGDIVNYLENR